MGAKPQAPGPGKHACPRHDCNRVVSDHLFCCYNDWRALSPEARKEIWRTAKLPIIAPMRRAAIQACLQEWDALSSGSKR